MSRVAMRAAAILLLISACCSFRIRSKNKRWAECSWIGCGAAYNRSRPCQCNNECRRYRNCCPDYSDLCENSPSPSPSPSPTCSSIGCGAAYNRSSPCQCNDQCRQYGNCCADYGDLCEAAPNPSPSPSPDPSPSPPASPAPAPGMNATAYWVGVDMTSKAGIQARLRNGATRLSYSRLWDAYKEMWVNLPGKCQKGVYDVYSTKCWTPGSGQCGSYRREGDCYNREHSWPKSWWSRTKNSAFSDVFHVMPSDGYVNGRRGSFPFGEVSRPSYSSSEGNKVGSCATPGYSGTCFEPTDRVKGTMARGALYMTIRYMNEFNCCSKEAVDGAILKPWALSLMLKWNAAYAPEAWEVEFNNRAQKWQGNRNPFIDYPQAAQQLFR